MSNKINNEINQEIIRLYLEASGLIVKLCNKLESERYKNADNHIAAAKDFIKKNKFYEQVLKYYSNERN